MSDPVSSRETDRSATSTETSVVITNIAELVTNNPESDQDVSGETLLGIRHDAAVVITGDRISWVGPASEAPDADRRIDLGGRALLPGFVESHSHLIYDGDRSAEFAARMTGEKYDGAGIVNTVTPTRAASDDRLRSLLKQRIERMRDQGTTTVEIKSGYGLTVDDERRALQIAGEFTTETTYLGAHVVPTGTDRRDYVDLVCGDMLEACAPHARWIDVFCEPHSAHAFDGDETREILTAGVAAGLLPRLHGGQLGEGPGIQLAVEYNAGSVDHCTYFTDADVDALAGSNTVATLLPGVEFSTRSPYPSGRRLIDAGVTVALATDCNPGTCNSNSIPTMIGLAVRDMVMTPAEAVWAVTAAGAQALRRDDIGVIREGNRADFAVVDAPSYLHIPYQFGVPIVRALQVAQP